MAAPRRAVWGSLFVRRVLERPLVATVRGKRRVLPVPLVAEVRVRSGEVSLGMSVFTRRHKNLGRISRLAIDGALVESMEAGDCGVMRVSADTTKEAKRQTRAGKRRVNWWATL
jgi:hypothetical protein